MSATPLFGGALSCAVPEGFADVSTFRQVPDNQEVFANAQTDQCVIVELLQYEAGVSNEESAKFFFNEIASSNGCAPGDVTLLHSEVLTPASSSAPSVNREHTVSVFVGDQRVAKFKESDAAKNVVRVYIGNVRLPSVETDVVISVSVPLRISDASSSRDAFQFENSAEIGAEIFKQVVKSFAVHDWSLFQAIMGGSKKRTAGHTTGAKGALVHARSEREKIHLDRKQRQLRVLASTLNAPGDPTNEEVGDTHFQQLRELAFSPHGFVSDELRRKLWPVLLGEGNFKPVGREDGDHFTKKNAPHRDDQQIQKDIDRSMWHYDVVTGIREPERRVKRKQLTQVINAVLVDNPDLYYYQGYHDVCSVFLLVLGDQLAFQATRQVSASYQREPMRQNFEIVLHATRLLYPLLASEDPELFAHLKESGVEPFFALPWMITWFAHQLSRIGDVARLYDVLLVSHPLFILYLSAAVVLDARHRVLKTECDFGTLHGMLAKLPQTMDIERIIPRAALIFHRLPPATLLAGSDNHAELRASTYALFPFPFHTRFPSIDHEFLPPALYRKREPLVPSDGHKSTGWQSSMLVRAAVLGFVVVSLSFVLRDHLRPWVAIADANDADGTT